ncbi:MAG: hypothetical protein A2041_08070 [Bacteroidetes bacterium GWA2_31_9b]|nr:MAG: hypothetical protein A2041_08070 [Bacteroidetes bacterium GWA2_31_9b]
MKDRILQFLKDEKISSTKFADIIGVQRSSISHILSGRNKPSFDFIEKMLLSFPSLNAQWLITGKGSMFTNTPRQESLFDLKIDSNQQKSTTLQSIIPKQENINTEISDNDQHIETGFLKSEKKEKIIDRIIIFFEDGSFKQYKAE